MHKAIILVGGPQKGTRFRPLSLDVPTPLVPIAGYPMIYHHMEACLRIQGLKEIIVIGYYPANDSFGTFIREVQLEFKIPIRYLQEYAPLGTAGTIYHFRDQILAGQPESIFVMGGDIGCEFPLNEMLEFHNEKGGSSITIMSTEATRQQSMNYGCLVADKDTNEITHYVSKPGTFVSSLINCGVYIFPRSIFNDISKVYQEKMDSPFDEFGAYQDREFMCLDNIFPTLCGKGNLYSFKTKCFWSQIKSAGAAIYANRHYLSIYNRTHPERLAKSVENGPKIIGDVYIHPKASVDPTAVLGPNVTISSNVTVGPGVRIRESIVLEGSVLKDHCCVMYTIIGWNSSVGVWTRVEGTPNDPNPNKPFAKIDLRPLFDDNGRLNPSTAVIGSNVHVPGEAVLLNSMVLPHKELNRSVKNEIIL